MRSTLLMLLALFSATATVAAAADLQEITLHIKNHQFVPAQLAVPAKVKFKLIVVNDDPTPEEFESKEMKVEKVIPGKSKGVVRIGPLAPGRYPFFGEFNEATAKGTVIAE